MVALELPGALEDVYLQALARLPQMSLIVYPDAQDDERASTCLWSPAIHSPKPSAPASTPRAEIVFAEPDAAERPHVPDDYPDTYAIRHIGLERYVEAYRVWPVARTEEIDAHAAGIAWKLQGTDPWPRCWWWFR